MSPYNGKDYMFLTPSVTYQTGYSNISHRIHVWYILATFDYIWLIFMVNVGIYAIHGSFGYEFIFVILSRGETTKHGKICHHYCLLNCPCHVSGCQWNFHECWVLNFNQIILNTVEIEIKWRSPSWNSWKKKTKKQQRNQGFYDAKPPHFSQAESTGIVKSWHITTGLAYLPTWKPIKNQPSTSWWFQPNWKIFVKLGIFPK